ncbi:MAG TPA: hypothetical protein VHO29_09875 [Marmoricola sp.]|nr:hypothetical protein [Marmoricola sp.]
MEKNGLVGGGQELTTTARVLVIQAAVFIAGGLLLWWVATPLHFDEMSSLDSISWPLLWLPALAFAAPSGAVAGLSIRLGWRWWVPATVLVVIGLLALYAPMFFVAKWPGSTAQETNVTDLLAAVAGWTLYEITSSALAVTIGIAGGRHFRVEPNH